MINKIAKITVFVESQEEAKKFWTEKMGFVVTDEKPVSPDMTWLELSPQGSDSPAIIFFPKNLMMQRYPQIVAHPSIMFSAENIEELWEQLNENGVEISEIQENSFGKIFDFLDNEGNPYMVRG